MLILFLDILFFVKVLFLNILFFVMDLCTAVKDWFESLFSSAQRGSPDKLMVGRIPALDLPQDLTTDGKFDRKKLQQLAHAAVGPYEVYVLRKGSTVFLYKDCYKPLDPNQIESIYLLNFPNHLLSPIEDYLLEAFSQRGKHIVRFECQHKADRKIPNEITFSHRPILAMTQ